MIYKLKNGANILKAQKGIGKAAQALIKAGTSSADDLAKMVAYEDMLKSGMRIYDPVKILGKKTGGLESMPYRAYRGYTTSGLLHPAELTIGSEPWLDKAIAYRKGVEAEIKRAQDIKEQLDVINKNIIETEDYLGSLNKRKHPLLGYDQAREIMRETNSLNYYRLKAKQLQQELDNIHIDTEIFKKGGTIKLQNAATKIPYSSSTYDGIPDNLNTTQSIMNSFQEQADNTLQGYLRKRQTALEAERKNRTPRQRILTALNSASDAQNQSGMTEKVAQEYLNQGDIKGATDVSKEGLKGAALGYLTSLTIPIGAEFVGDISTYGLLGGAGKQIGMGGGSYLLGKGGEEVGKGFDNIFNTGKTFETGFGLAGSLAGFGGGSKSGYNLAKSTLAKRMATKGVNSVPNGVATNAMKRDLVNDAYNAGGRYTPTNYKKLPEGSSNYETPVMQYGSFTPATATNASGDKFLAKTPQEQDNIVRYGNGEKYGNFNVLKYDKNGLASFKRGGSKLK